MALAPIQSGIEDTKTLEFTNSSPFDHNLISGVTGLFLFSEIQRNKGYSARATAWTTQLRTAACNPCAPAGRAPL